MNATQDQTYLKSLTVLYVEDDDDTRWLYSKIMSETTDGVIPAKNGAEGLEAYLKHKPDIVVTDILMPVMDGLTMAREIRTHDTSAPIIVLSAFNLPEYLQQAEDIGIDNYVIRPEIGSQLHDALLDCAHRLMLEEQQSS